MENIKTGDIIVGGDYKHKVLAVLEDIVFISEPNAFEKSGCYRTKTELKELGYTIQKAKWEPTLGGVYWYIDNEGFAEDNIWGNDETDNDRENFLGIYETKGKAEKALLEIKKKLK